MEILILGTAAAEAWPAPFCICPACEKARQRRGPNIRTRSGALIDNELKIDFGPDTVMQMQRCHRNLLGVKTLIFTHQHSDHIAVSELEWAKHPFTLTPGGRIELWGNAEVIEEINQRYTQEQRQSMPFDYHTLKAGDHFKTEAGDDVWVMPANHCQGATILRIRRQGKTIFYGHDTGSLLPGALERLSDGVKLDLALLDCTFGSDDHNDHHMGVAGVVRTTADLRKRGAITDNTRVIATHFSHGGTMMHEELCAYFLPHKIGVAYDGMVVEI